MSTGGGAAGGGAAGGSGQGGGATGGGLPDAGAVTLGFVQAAGAGAVSAAFVSPQTAGDLNVVVMGWGDATTTLAGVTDSQHNTYVLAVATATGVGSHTPKLRQAIYFARNIAAGPNTVTVMFNGVPMLPDLKVLEYRGAGPAGANATASGDGTGGTVSSGPFSAGAGALVVAAGMTTDRFSGPGAGFAPRIQSNDGNIVEDTVTASAGMTQATLSLSSNAQSWLMQVITFGGTAGGPDGGMDGGVDGGSAPDAGPPPDGGLRTYSTAFSANENPISEGGAWLNGKTDGVDWADVQTAGGVAHGTVVSLGPPYDDSTAVLKGPWANDQAACATVHLVNATSSIFEEVELRLRTSISAHSIGGYEFNFRAVADGNQYVEIVRWNGPLNSFTYVQQTTGPGIHDGDRICATAIGDTLSAFINDAGVVSGTDTMFPSGSPGIGFYMQNGTASQLPDYGFTSFSAEER
jgi:hypothetical protein